MFIDKKVIKKKNIREKIGDLLKRFRMETDIGKIDKFLKPMVLFVFFNNLYEMLIMLSARYNIVYEFSYWRLLIKIFDMVIIIYFIKLKNDEKVKYT